jgi:hypothetical protein
LLPVETATALLPRQGAIRQQGELRMVSMPQGAVQVYELDYHHNDNDGRDKSGDESHGFFFAVGDKAWSFGPWSSDARVLYCRIEKEKLAHLVVIGGTYVAWQGKPLLKAAGPFEFFEWRGEDALTNSAPGESSVTPVFEELTRHSSSPYAEKH